MVDLDFAAHAPHWLVGRSGKTRKSKKKLPKNDSTDSVELAKMREEIAAEIDDKMNKKLRKIFGRLVKMNPTVNVIVDELCAESSVEADGDEEDGDEEDEAEVDSDGDEAAT